MTILLTGGAGFIGSHLARYFTAQPEVEKVIVLDNFSTGSSKNIRELLSNTKFEVVRGDIEDYGVCLATMQGCTHVCHQAALGSVPRSIARPLTTNGVNITGTLNIFTAAKELDITRIVYAASSSTYGDSKDLPKEENSIGQPLSPYAVTKLVNELYARVYGDLYGMEFIGLRYFNVFGPRQSPDGPYAAVIPIFIDSILSERHIPVNGDGSYSRDFTYVENVVQANWKALTTQRKDAVNTVYNIACGQRTSLNQLIEIIASLSERPAKVRHRTARIGDVPHSLASIEKAIHLLDYKPAIAIREGLAKTIAYFQVSSEWHPSTELDHDKEQG